MKFFLGLFVIVLYNFGCTNTKTTDQADQTIDSSINIKQSFFPVTSFLQGQMLQFDSMLVTPLHTITINDKTDSEWIIRTQLKGLLQSFLTPEINDSNLTKYFKETKFDDQTLNAITFIYTPIAILPDSINLVTWNVYANPQTGKITRIYIVKKIKEKEGNITQQLTWLTDKDAEITTIQNNPDGKSEVLKKEKFIWNFD